MAETISNPITLPDRLVSAVDLSRIVRELDALNESLYQAELRQPGQPTKLATSSPVLEELAQLNGANLTDKAQRTALLERLQAFQKVAPVMHMSVAAEPSGPFLRKLITWLRSNIHPQLLMNIGLQPTLAAGCMIRTNNKIFDMSLRHRFEESKQLLAEQISGSTRPLV